MILRVFIQSQEALKNMPKLMLNRILSTLNIDPTDHNFPIEFSTFEKFKKILIAKSASQKEMIDFLTRVIEFIIGSI